MVLIFHCLLCFHHRVTQGHVLKKDSQGSGSRHGRRALGVRQTASTHSDDESDARTTVASPTASANDGAPTQIARERRGGKASGGAAAAKSSGGEKQESTLESGSPKDSPKPLRRCLSGANERGKRPKRSLSWSKSLREVKTRTPDRSLSVVIVCILLMHSFIRCDRN